MKFNFLSQIQQEASKLNLERKETLEPLLREGLDLLNQAEANGFQNIALLKQAARLFLKAQQGNQRDVRPYLFVAYVFLLLGDPMRSSAHLNLARRQDPTSALVKEFSEQLMAFSQKQKQKQKPKTSNTHKQLDFSKDRDPDQLYDHLEQIILSEVRQLQILVPPQSDAPESECEHFHSLIQQAQQNFDDIQAQIHELDQHLDTYALKSRLRPMELLLKRHQIHYQSLQFVPQIQGSLDQLRADLNQAMYALERDLPKDKQPLEAQLEQLLDRLDAVADQIDELEAKGFKNPQLEQNYKFVMHRLEDYQDQLDALVL